MKQERLLKALKISHDLLGVTLLKVVGAFPITELKETTTIFQIFTHALNFVKKSNKIFFLNK